MDRSISRSLARIFGIVIIFMMSKQAHADLSSLARNDAYPMFTTLDPHELLFTKQKLNLKGDPYGDEKADLISISISPFGQNADRGQTINGQSVVAGIPVELGDLPSRTNMIPLLFGEIPEGQMFPPLLLDAFANLYPGIVPGTLEDPKAIDHDQRFGFFTFPTKYRKRGVRFDLMINFIGGLGIRFQTGVASITQTHTQRDLTACADPVCPFDPSPLTTANVRCFLTDQIEDITEQLGINIDNFCEVSVEEIRIELFWRNCYELNSCSPYWKYILFTPFLMVGGSISAGKKKDPSKFFGVPFGNNEHSAVGFSAGMDFDFADTVEIGSEIGVTHFLEKDCVNARIPTSKFQTGFFPFTTDVKVKPGLNWHFAAKLASYHFIDCLSFYFEYVQLEHKNDDILICNGDPAFKPEVLAKTTGFKMKIANIGFNYDLSENIGLGFLWQAPLSQRNSYKSTTIMLGFNATF